MSHPSDRAIQRWLESGQPPDVDSHIGGCDRCTEVADRMTTGSVTGWVSTFLAAPDDFEVRIAERVESAISRWEAIEAIAGLFTIGAEAMNLIVGERPAHEQR